MNRKNIAVGNWVTSENKVGKIVREGEKGEFWVLWSGDSLPMNESAKSLQIVDYEGEDLAGKTFKDGRCNRLVYEYGVKAEVYLEHKKKPQIWSLEKLANKLKEENPPFDKPIMLPISQIRRDGGTQPRASLNHETVMEYAEDMKNGDNFPPVTVFYNGSEHWLADGFHRVEAGIAAGLTEIAAVVKQGLRRDAVLYSVGANAKHGLRRSNADKRRAVMTLLEDEEWSQLSDREIARRCGVGNKFVGDVRRSLCSEHSDKSGSNRERTYTTKHGTTAKMNTANIGKGKSSEPLPPSAEDKELTLKSSDKEVTTASSEENNQPSDAPTDNAPPDNAPPNIRDLLSEGDRVRIKDNHEFGGQFGIVTLIPNRKCAVVEFSPGFRKVIQLFDFDLSTDNLPADNASADNATADNATADNTTTDNTTTDNKPPNIRKLLSEGDRVKIKDDHYFGGQSGIITSFPNRDSVIVEFSPGKRELINLKDLDLQQKRQPKPPKKKEIIIQEGLNYKAGCPGYGCKWYVEVSEENYKRLQEYREKVGTITLDAAIGRFLEEENNQKPVNSDDVCIGLTSNLEQLPDDRIQLVVNAIAKFRPKIICQAAKAIGANSLDMEED